MTKITFFSLGRSSTNGDAGDAGESSATALLFLFDVTLVLFARDRGAGFLPSLPFTLALLLARFDGVPGLDMVIYRAHHRTRVPLRTTPQGGQREPTTCCPQTTNVSAAEM